MTRKLLNPLSYIENKIKEQLKNCIYFSFCMDESTDVNDLSQLVICIRCIDHEYNIFETMISLETFCENVTGKILWEVIRDKLFSIVDIKKLSGVCTDGANVMMGKYEGFTGQMKKNGIHVENFHCMVHQAAMAAKFLSKSPTMKIAEKIINKIRGGHNSLTHRKFVSFLKKEGKSTRYQNIY